MTQKGKSVIGLRNERRSKETIKKGDRNDERDEKEQVHEC